MTKFSFDLHPMRSLLGGALLASLLAACSPIVNNRGYVPDAERVASIEIGVDNKESVYQRLGSPSVTPSFDNDIWYYISDRHEQFAFFAPKVTERKIVAVRFDDSEIVNEIANFGLEDGKIINFQDRATPTRGKELGFLEQMFGNIGRLPAPGAGR